MGTLGTRLIRGPTWHIKCGMNYLCENVQARVVKKFWAKNCLRSNLRASNSEKFAGGA